MIRSRTSVCSCWVGGNRMQQNNVFQQKPVFNFALTVVSPSSVTVGPSRALRPLRPALLKANVMPQSSSSGVCTRGFTDFRWAPERNRNPTEDAFLVALFSAGVPIALRLALGRSTLSMTMPFVNQVGVAVICRDS